MNAKHTQTNQDHIFNEVLPRHYEASFQQVRDDTKVLCARCYCDLYGNRIISKKSDRYTLYDENVSGDCRKSQSEQSVQYNIGGVIQLSRESPLNCRRLFDFCKKTALIDFGSGEAYTSPKIKHMTFQAAEVSTGHVFCIII